MAFLETAGGRPGGGDIKSMTAVEEYRLRDRAYAVLGVEPEELQSHSVDKVLAETRTRQS